jgi:hypothetical protein
LFGTVDATSKDIAPACQGQAGEGRCAAVRADIE